MTAETLSPRRGLFASVAESPGWQRFTASWLYRFVLFPLGQMLTFIVITATILTILAYLLALIAPQARANFLPTDLISLQLPGMIVNGIALGFIYAMIALGYTLVYGVLKFINFAHSEIFMFGSVVAFEFLSRLAATTFTTAEGGTVSAITQWNPFALVVCMIGLSMLFAGTLAAIIERVAYRPLRRAPRLVPLITAIGISFVLQDSIRAFEALTRNDFNLTYPTRELVWLGQPLRLAIEGTQINVNIRLTQIIIVVGAVLMLLALNYFVNGTKIGRGIRAVSQDQVTAGLMGINVNLLITITFFVGGALGGAAGALYGLNVGTVTPYIGTLPGLKAFTAAVLGGIGNVTGALLGGLTLGLIESFLNGTLGLFPALGARYTDVFAFFVLILILIFRPSGLLGERVDEKV